MSQIYRKASKAFEEASIDLTSDTIKAMIVTAAYTPDFAAHQFVADVASGIVARSGALTSKTTTGGVFDAADVTYAAVAGGSTIDAIIIYKDTGSDATSPLLAYIDTMAGGSPISIITNGSDVIVTWDDSGPGIFRL